jgi:hypothetical protein
VSIDAVIPDISLPQRRGEITSAPTSLINDQPTRSMKPSLRFHLSFITALLFCAVSLPAEELQATKPDESVLKPAGDGWLPIFNGKNLEGWTAEPEFWKADEGGILHGHTPGTPEHHYAYTKKSYGDFELHADVKLVGNNSGICIRIAPTSFDNVPGYQVDMGEGYWGCLWDERGRGMVAKYSKEDAAKLVKKDDWNHYYVRAEGHQIQAWLNGVKTIDVVDEKGLLAGPIGFQLCHGKGSMTDASFKNVVYRPIKTANAN